MDFFMPGMQSHVKAIYPGLSEADVTRKTGLLFVVFACGYGLGTPIIGKLCVHLGPKSSRPAMFIGAVMTTGAYLFLGPQENLAEWTGLVNSTLSTKVVVHGTDTFFMGNFAHISICLVIMGIGVALIAVPSIEDLIQCCYKAGLPKEGMATVAIVSGFYNCLLFVGEFVGPMAQGFSLDLIAVHKKSSTDDVRVISDSYRGYGDVVFFEFCDYFIIIFLNIFQLVRFILSSTSACTACGQHCVSSQPFWRLCFTP